MLSCNPVALIATHFILIPVWKGSMYLFSLPRLIVARQRSLNRTATQSASIFKWALKLPGYSHIGSILHKILFPTVFRHGSRIRCQLASTWSRHAQSSAGHAMQRTPTAPRLHICTETFGWNESVSLHVQRVIMLLMCMLFIHFSEGQCMLFTVRMIRIGQITPWSWFYIHM